MIKITTSKAVCSNCGKKIEINWEIVSISVSDNKPMGESAEYGCESDSVCPFCGTRMISRMTFSEYPVGVLESTPVIEELDNNSPMEVEIPEVTFYDL